MDDLEAERVSRHGSRGGADVEDLMRAAVEVDVDVLHPGPLARGEALAGQRDEEVVQPRGAVAGAVDEHEAASAGAGQRALGDPRHEGGGYAGIDGVPALAQHDGAGLGGERMPRSDRALHRPGGYCDRGSRYDRPR